MRTTREHKAQNIDSIYIILQHLNPKKKFQPAAYKTEEVLIKYKTSLTGKDKFSTKNPKHKNCAYSLTNFTPFRYSISPFVYDVNGVDERRKRAT